MKNSTSTLLFFHGLNTFGDDLLHVGPVTLGRMDRHVVAGFTRREFQIFSINGIGAGSPEQQADQALLQIETLVEKIPKNSTVHLLGNSMGGLVARVVATRLQNSPLLRDRGLHLGRLISWGTPHRGSRAVEIAKRFAPKSKISTFEHYSPQALDSFNLRFPLDGATSEHSFICSVPLAEVSPYFWGLYGYIHGLNPIDFVKTLTNRFDSHRPSDGFITLGSQAWGHRHGPYRLEHFAQAGFFTLIPRAARRREAEKEFNRLLDDMTELLNSPFMRAGPVEVSDSPNI